MVCEPARRLPRTVKELDPARRQRAATGQGPISLHSEEHLVTSDKGIGMQRRMLRRAMEVMAAGDDAPGVGFDEGAVVAVPSGNFFAG